MPHTRAKTELRHGRPNLLQSVINTIIFRLDVEEKANLDKQDLFRLFIEILNN